MNDYYVYSLTDLRDNSVFYIGKGKADRIQSHFKDLEKYTRLIENGIGTSKGKFSNHSKTARMYTIKKAGLETKVEKLIENINEHAALTLEQILVDSIGREIIESGPLLNIEPGGKWKYPKLVLFDYERIDYSEAKEAYPELSDILVKYPFRSTRTEKELNIIKYILSKELDE